MGVAEWRLKINQPSLFQFVRKQKRKEIIKRERVGKKIKGRGGELNHPDPKCTVKLEKRRELRLLGIQKEKEILLWGFFFYVCFFKTSSALPDMAVSPSAEVPGL